MHRALVTCSLALALGVSSCSASAGTPSHCEAEACDEREDEQGETEEEPTEEEEPSEPECTPTEPQPDPAPACAQSVDMIIDGEADWEACRVLYACDPDGPGAECPIQNPASFGDCDEPVGAVFDGGHCVEARGCLDSESCPAFSSITECAFTCARAGWARSDKFGFLFFADCIPPYPPCAGGITTICTDGTVDEMENLLNELLPDHYGRWDCEQFCSRFCASHMTCCSGSPYQSDSYDTHAVHATSLLRPIDSFHCFFWE